MHLRGALTCMLLFPLAAQDPPRSPIRTTVPLVLVPTTVVDDTGKPITGLEESDFLLYEGKRPRPHRLEQVTQPVAVLFCIQTNARADPALRKLPAISSLVLPLIAGEGGKAALLTFSDRITLRQDFTRDPNEVHSAFRSLHPDGENAPVQNISHAAAQQYCEWITRVYNCNTGKKKFKKVLFRLPTQEEWTLAAAGGKKQVPYPWGGYYLRNSKGCYLCNLNATEPCGDCPEGKGADNDGGFFTVPVTSYFPNDFGLYCVSGNVAEMLQQEGITMGGSWKDIGYKCQISVTDQYTESGPTIGFRVFMEVIEE